MLFFSLNEAQLKHPTLGPALSCMCYYYYYYSTVTVLRTKQSNGMPPANRRFNNQQSFRASPLLHGYIYNPVGWFRGIPL